MRIRFTNFPRCTAQACSRTVPQACNREVRYPATPVREHSGSRQNLQQYLARTTIPFTHAVNATPDREAVYSASADPSSSDGYCFLFGRLAYSLQGRPTLKARHSSRG